MDIFGILIEQIGLFAIYIIIGVIMVKSGVLDAVSLEAISRFVLKMALPVMNFTSIVHNVDRADLLSSFPILLLAVVFYIFMFGAAKGMTCLFRIKAEQKGVYQALAMFGNIGFMGIPIITSIFPEKGMLYISIFLIIDQLTLWTVGVKLLTSSKEERFNPWKLLNPASVSIVLAVVCVIGMVPVPEILDSALQKITTGATPMAMIYLGGLFACADIRKYITQKELYGIVGIKMCLIPILLYLLLEQFLLDKNLGVTVALIAGMPTMSAVVIMAKGYGADGDCAMGSIVVTTVCSAVTLPTVFWVLQYLLV